jgi:signal transduction histidine kinase
MKGNDSHEARGAGLFSMPSLTAAAHELKSPLVLIRQLTHELNEEGLDDGEIAKLAERLELTSDRALRLVEDLTQTSRLQDAIFEMEPINPTALCNQVAREIQPLYRAHDRHIEAQLRRSSLLVVANQTLLTRVLMNFADNALHYSSPDAPVRFETRQHKDKVRISVRDYGPGVSTKLWRSFALKGSSLDQPSRRPASSGLGLYIAKQCAVAMGGDVGVVRHRDGASFYVELTSSSQLSLL